MKKLLLALQFYDGDRKQAIKLARLIADLQPAHTRDFDFMFAARYDSSHCEETVMQVSKKFNCWQHTATRRGDGWPFGPNQLFFDTVGTIAARCREGTLPRYDAVLTLESDDVPLAADWLVQLHDEWRRTGVRMLGTIIPSPGRHINGNCLLSGDPDYLAWLGNVRCPVNAGWDWVLAPHLERRGWADTPLIRSYWHTKTLEWRVMDNLATQGVVLLHGVKDDSGFKWARERLLKNSCPSRAAQPDIITGA